MLAERFDKSMEEKWQKYWQENEIYKFNDAELKITNGRPIYSIDTPLPLPAENCIWAMC